MLWDTPKRFLEVLHPVEAAFEFPLHIGHGLGVSLGDSCDASVGLPDILLKGGLVGLQSFTVLGLSGFKSLEEFSHIGRHRKMSSLVELNKSNRFGRDAVRILTNEGNVPAHV